MSEHVPPARRAAYAAARARLLEAGVPEAEAEALLLPLVDPAHGHALRLRLVTNNDPDSEEGLLDEP